MKVITHRAFTRNGYRTSIHYSDCSAKEYHEGVMINSCVGGMAFLTGLELKPGDRILIQIDIAPDPYWLDAKRNYFAEVRWCRKKEGAVSPSYQVGVRFFVEVCRLCDKTIHQCTADSEALCEDCRDHTCSLSDGTIKDCIEKFILGNVL
jgi:hypothetical protein